jgi:hypothetical protein
VIASRVVDRGHADIRSTEATNTGQSGNRPLCGIIFAEDEPRLRCQSNSGSPLIKYTLRQSNSVPRLSLVFGSRQMQFGSGQDAAGGLQLGPFRRSDSTLAFAALRQQGTISNVENEQDEIEVVRCCDRQREKP